MLRGLKEMDTGDRVLPFVRRFYGQPSLHIWEDEVGDVQDIPQGEGGDQDDPLMPLLFSLAMHPSLVSTGDLLRGGEKIFAFLDDVHLICKPERLLEIFRHRERIVDPFQDQRIAARRNSGTAVGPHPEDARISPELPGLCSRLARGPSFASRATGRRQGEVDEQGDGTPDAPERTLLVRDVQSAWLLLLFCAATRANYRLNCSARSDSSVRDGARP